VEPIAARSEVARLDEALVAAGTVEATIERVGYQVARMARRLLGGAYGRRVLVVAGPGNNGQDAMAAGRWLARSGARVAVRSLREVLAGTAADEVARADLVIDGALGTGAARPLAPLGLEVARRVLAVDIPSGIDADTGAVIGAELGGSAVAAAHTVTVGALKPGLLLGQGPEHAGSITRVLPGLVPEGVRAWLVGRADVVGALPRPRRDAHKWASGLLVLGGSPGMSGAPAFVARGAGAVGAGIVHVVTRGEPRDAVAIEVVPEAVVRRLVTGHVDAALADVGRFGACVVGPGLGDTLASANLVRRVVLGLDVPFVLDADGLTSLAGEGRLAAVLAARRAPAVITPHAGELARIAPHLEGDPLAKARAAAAQFGVVVLLKGNPTVVASPDGQAFVIASGTARLAAAGTGDVLAGVIGGLMAEGLDPVRAAWAGAWLHGKAGAQLGARLARPTELAAAIARLVGELVPIPGHPASALEEQG
jgi:hydroxyethylthiazole kinase-like uncharacterized protein yjeF